MKVNTIIRGCDIKEDSETERDLLEKRVAEKVESISLETKKAMFQLLETFTDLMKQKVDDFEKYKEELREEYDEKIKSLQDDAENSRLKVISIGEKLKEEGLDKVEKHIEDSKEEIKDLTLMLFEKFFYTEYNNIENLESLIKHELETMEEMNKVKVSINKRLLQTNEDLQKISSNFSNDNRITFKTHSKESLFLEIQNEKETLEYDFNKQMKKIKDVMKNFK